MLRRKERLGRVVYVKKLERSKFRLFGMKLDASLGPSVLSWNPQSPGRLDQELFFRSMYVV